jgi:hypothetical protein
MLIGLSDMRDDLLKLHANGGMETGLCVLGIGSTLWWPPLLRPCCLAWRPQAEIFWIIGTIAMALLVWFSGAKAQQREREAKEREKETERAVMGRFDELTQLLAKPDTTLEDVRRIVGDQAHFEGVIGLKR